MLPNAASARRRASSIGTSSLVFKDSTGTFPFFNPEFDGRAH
jgi:hypothetical protein